MSDEHLPRSGTDENRRNASVHDADVAGLPTLRRAGCGRATYGSRGDVELMVRLALRLRALGAERCDALVATGVTPTGGWR